MTGEVVAWTEQSPGVWLRSSASNPYVLGAWQEGDRWWWMVMKAIGDRAIFVGCDHQPGADLARDMAERAACQDGPAWGG